MNLIIPERLVWINWKMTEPSCTDGLIEFGEVWKKMMYIGTYSVGIKENCWFTIRWYFCRNSSFWRLKFKANTGNDKSRIWGFLYSRTLSIWQSSVLVENWSFQLRSFQFRSDFTDINDDVKRMEHGGWKRKSETGNNQS